jgi:hypothetical protein
MKVLGGGGYCVYPHAFVTPAIDGNDWLSSPSGCFIPEDGTRGTLEHWCWVDYTDDLDNSVIEPMSFPNRESNLDCLACNWVTIPVSCLWNGPEQCCAETVFGFCVSVNERRREDLSVTVMRLCKWTFGLRGRTLSSVIELRYCVGRDPNSISTIRPDLLPKDTAKRGSVAGWTGCMNAWFTARRTLRSVMHVCSGIV